MDNYLLTSVHFTTMEDINTLQNQGLIGSELRPGLLKGSVITFRKGDCFGGVSVYLEDKKIYARLLCPTNVPEADLTLLVKSSAHTLYKAREVIVDLNPIYTREECVHVA